MELDVTLPSAEVSHSMFTFGNTINIETSIGLVRCIMAGNAVSLLTSFMLRNNNYSGEYDGQYDVHFVEVL